MESRKDIFRHLPNFITCLNILCGALAVIFIFEGHLLTACLLVACGAIFDFMDGLTARAIHAYSNIGKDLDSLADMVSFGVVPGMMVFHLMKQTFGIQGFSDACSCQYLWLLMPMLIIIFSGLRLAKFNNDTRQTESFIGLATPANTIMIGSLPLVLGFYPELTWFSELVLNKYFLAILSVFSSLMLVAELPMFSFKFKSFALGKNILRYSFLVTIIVLVIFLGWLAVPLFIPIYILLSVFEWITKSKEVKE